MTNKMPLLIAIILLGVVIVFNFFPKKRNDYIKFEYKKNNDSLIFVKKNNDSIMKNNINIDRQIQAIKEKQKLIDGVYIYESIELYRNAKKIEDKNKFLKDSILK